MTDERERLRRVPIFSGLDDADLDLVAAAAAPFEVEAGHVLVEPHQPGSGMFVLVDGEVEVDLPGGAVVTLGPGEFFGELSLLADVDRIARVRARTRLTGFAIARRAFREMLDAEPAIAVRMLEVLARRLATLESSLGG